MPPAKAAALSALTSCNTTGTGHVDAFCFWPDDCHFLLPVASPACHVILNGMCLTPLPSLCLESLIWNDWSGSWAPSAGSRVSGVSNRP